MTVQIEAPLAGPQGVLGRDSWGAGHLLPVRQAPPHPAEARSPTPPDDVASTLDWLRWDALAVLLTGEGEPHAVARGRARRLGIDLAAEHLVLAIGPDSSDSDWSAQLGAVLAAQLLDRQGYASQIGVVGDLIVVVLAMDSSSPEGVSSGLYRWLTARLRQPVAIGVGRNGSGIEGIRRGFVEARQALDSARTIELGCRIVRFGDLKIERLLLALGDQSELTAFYEATVAPLDRHDPSIRADLVTTLDAYFAADLNVQIVVARLGVHRNTVHYRLKRVEEILGRSLKDPGVRLELELGLRVRAMLRGRDGRLRSKRGQTALSPSV